MKEALFIRQNYKKWQKCEIQLKNVNRCSPDELADIYIDITNDLSFARTHYPRSKVALYLNELSTKLHQFIHGKKRESFSSIFTFWTTKVPLTMYETRKELLYSFILFSVCVLIGAVSTAHDSEFPRIILGDHYVDMTLQNINNGDPMAVYKDHDSYGMFLGITINNIRVSFYTFIAGVFTSLGTGYILFSNGVMLGAFQWFFVEQDLFKESFLAIWIHGTLEISAIIIAGAAGIVMGNGWLFPGTYSRIVSFKKGAKKGLKIIVGLIPIFIIAGFLESYLTRETGLPDITRLLVIILSLAFILFYFVFLPLKVGRRHHFDLPEASEEDIMEELTTPKPEPSKE